ncbi:substrate-binding domain-containing protein [Roseibium sp. SCP14]|uniref:substrate-binding domain-containing protein n=1 Tax=Roseibium sp. SCP14 TaxID=3141375 RepID=UPI00333B91EC
MADSPNGSAFIDKLRAEFSELAAGSRVPTIRDVAASHSVSQFSVQRAFEALKEEGLIQSFVGRGSFIAGADQVPVSQDNTKSARVLIVSHSTPSRRGAEIATHLQSALHEVGHKPISVTYSDVSDLRDLLGKGGFDVCVLQPRRSILPVEALALLKSKARHMIVEGRQLELLDVDVIVRNRAKSIAMALKHLRTQGHRRIGLVTERLDAGAGYGEIENLYTQSLSSLPGRAHSLVLRVNDGSPDAAEGIAACLNEEMGNAEMAPTAFVVSGRFSDDEIRRGFEQAGLSVPKDVSVVHLRAQDASTPVDRRLTAVGRNAEHVAKAIVDIVGWRLAHPNDPSGLVLDDPKLVEGSSTCAIPAD